jgi:hypothetical protein
MKTRVPCHLITSFLLASALVTKCAVAAAADDTAQAGPNFVVTMTDEHDDRVCGVNDCTLFEAIAAAEANSDASEITFQVGLSGTINIDKLASNGFLITQPLTISGPGARTLAISGNHVAANAFFISFVSASEMEIDNLTIADCVGHGAIYVFSGQLTMNNCTVTGNTSIDGSSGGGIFGAPSTSMVTLADCTFSDNVAEGDG